MATATTDPLIDIAGRAVSSIDLIKRAALDMARAWRVATPIEFWLAVPGSLDLYDAGLEAWEAYVDVQTTSARIVIASWSEALDVLADAVSSVSAPVATTTTIAAIPATSSAVIDAPIVEAKTVKPAAPKAATPKATKGRATTTRRTTKKTTTSAAPTPAAKQTSAATPKTAAKGTTAQPAAAAAPVAPASTPQTAPKAPVSETPKAKRTSASTPKTAAKKPATESAAEASKPPVADAPKAQKLPGTES